MSIPNVIYVPYCCIYYILSMLLLEKNTRSFLFSKFRYKSEVIQLLCNLSILKYARKLASMFKQKIFSRIPNWWITMGLVPGTPWYARIQVVLIQVIPLPSFSLSIGAFIHILIIFFCLMNFVTRCYLELERTMNFEWIEQTIRINNSRSTRGKWAT